MLKVIKPKATEETKPMTTITVSKVLDQLPVTAVQASMNEFLAPMMENLPDVRLGRVVPLAVQGILGSQSPVVTQMAQSVSRLESEVWPAAKRIYGLLQNARFSHAELAAGLYTISQASVARDELAYLVVAIDPVNFEKPYTEALEGVSTVYKSTPPDPQGRARLTRGYPCLTATVVNTRIPATVYANWFSYTTDFRSENIEIHRAIDATEQCFASIPRRFVLDSAFDDRKWFARLDEQEFVIRVSHFERIVEVYNARLERWETETLGDLVDVVPFTHTGCVRFTHARKTRAATLRFGWFLIRLPDTHQHLWVLVAHEERINRTCVLLTNVPLHSAHAMRAVYDDWRLRSRIEHGYRFDQEQGLDVEDMRVQTLERMRRLFLLVLAAAQFVFYLIDTWPTPAVQWLRSLGGKLHLNQDLDGPYLVLRGLSALFQTVATLTHVARHPFPDLSPTYG
jgi:hypothetical protein